jgi:predicted membrane metal-binding protein
MIRKKDMPKQPRNWFAITIIAIIIIFGLHVLLASCAVSPYNAICSTYGGVRRETKNFYYCVDGTVYDRENEYYLDRDRNEY